MLADKAYDADWIGDHIEQLGAAPNIPDNANRSNRYCLAPCSTASAIMAKPMLGGLHHHYARI